MAKPKRFRKEFGPWRGGLDERAPLTLEENTLSVCVNARVLWPSGEVAARSGTRVVNNSTLGGAVRNGTTYNTGPGATHVVVASDGNAYYGVGVNPNQAFTSLGGTPFNTGNTPQFATFYDNTGAQALYIADGAGKVSKLVGVTLTARVAATVPATVYRIAVFNERLFACSGADSTLYWSGLGNGDSLGDTTNGGGSAIIRPVNGDKLIGLLAIGQTLILFFEGSIGRFTGWSQDDIDIASGTRGLSTAVGLYGIYNIPVAADNNQGFFYGSDGEIYRITELGIEPVSGPLSIFRRLQNAAGAITLGQIGVWPHRGEVWCSTSAGTYVYNYRLGVWAGFFQDANTFGNETTVCRPPFWTYQTNSTERIFGADAITSVVMLDSADVAGAGQRTFGLDFVAANGTGGTALTVAIHCRPVVGDMAGDVVTRFNYLYISTGNIPIVGNVYETVGNLTRSGIAVGTLSTRTSTFSLAGSFDTISDSGPEYTVLRTQGQSQGNQITLGIDYNFGAADITHLGDVLLAKVAVEGFSYSTRTDPGPSL